MSAPPTSPDQVILPLESNAVAMGPHVFHVVDGALTVRRLDVDSGRFVGEPIVLARGIVTDPYSDGQVELAVGAAGAVAYVAGTPTTRTLRVVDSRGNPLVDLAAGDLRDVRVSPDGTRVAYEQIDHATGGRDIWVVGSGRRYARACVAAPRARRGADLVTRWADDLLPLAPVAAAGPGVHARDR